MENGNDLPKYLPFTIFFLRVLRGEIFPAVLALQQKYGNQREVFTFRTTKVLSDNLIVVFSSREFFKH